MLTDWYQIEDIKACRPNPELEIELLFKSGPEAKGAETYELPFDRRNPAAARKNFS